MQTLNFITGKEAVKILDNKTFSDFIEYIENENPDCFNERIFDNKKEMHQFVAGLEAGGYESYSIIDENEVKKIREAIA